MHPGTLRLEEALPKGQLPWQGRDAEITSSQGPHKDLAGIRTGGTFRHTSRGGRRNREKPGGVCKEPRVQERPHLRESRSAPAPEHRACRVQSRRGRESRQESVQGRTGRPVWVRLRKSKEGSRGV